MVVSIQHIKPRRNVFTLGRDRLVQVIKELTRIGIRRRAIRGELRPRHNFNVTGLVFGRLLDPFE